MLTVYKYAVAPSLETIDLDIPGGGPIISAGIDPRRQCMCMGNG